MSTTRAPIMQLDAERAQLAAAAASERRWPKVANGSLPPSTSSTRTVVGIEGAELAPQAA